MSNITTTHPEFTPPTLLPDEVHKHLEITSRLSHEAILDVLRQEPPNTVTIVALGPLTNLAHALRTDSKTFALVKTVVWMGGALDHPGNTSPSAEFNCFADPYAADEVLNVVKQGLFEMIICPLDITTPHQIPFSDLIVPVANTNTPIQIFISAMLQRVRGLQASFGLPDAMEMHDPVAMWYAIEHAGRNGAPGWRIQTREFKIERIGEYTRGMCVVDRRGTTEESDNRTKDQRLNGGTVPSLPPRNDEVDRMGKAVHKSQRLPYVVISTPGSNALRRLLLDRVFGQA